jgi:hypothetical protein
MPPWIGTRLRAAILQTTPGCTTSGGAPCRTAGSASQQPTSTGQRQLHALACVLHATYMKLASTCKLANGATFSYVQSVRDMVLYC